MSSPVDLKTMKRKKQMVFDLLNAKADSPKECNYSKINGILASKGLSISEKTFLKFRGEWREEKAKPKGMAAAKAAPTAAKVTKPAKATRLPYITVVRAVRNLLEMTSKEDAHQLIDELA